VKLRTKTTPKLSNRGTTCLYLGPAMGHPDDTHIMWDPVTGGVHVTRDVIWLKRMYYNEPVKADELVINVPAGEGGEAGEGRDYGWITVKKGDKISSLAKKPESILRKSSREIKAPNWWNMYAIDDKHLSKKERLQAWREAADTDDEEEEEQDEAREKFDSLIRKSDTTNAWINCEKNI
jgi:hypothetical protein